MKFAQHDAVHKQDFVDAVRNGKTPNFNIADGHIASALCHMGDTSCRVGRKLRFDPQVGCYVGDAEAADRHFNRDYRKPWVLPEV